MIKGESTMVQAGLHAHLVVCCLVSARLVGSAAQSALLSAICRFQATIHHHLPHVISRFSVPQKIVCALYS